MVAWISSPAGRRRIAGQGAAIVAVGAILYVTAPVSFSRPLGAILGLLGIAVVLWAILHRTISGLPSLPQSNECRSGMHEKCPVRSDLVKCSCICHLDDSNGEEAGWTWTIIAHYAAGPLIVVTFTGSYPPGSAGNDFAARMIDFLRKALRNSEAAGVIFDVRNLAYVSGDAIGGLALPLREGTESFRPAAIVAKPDTAAALEPLLTPDYALGLADMKVFDSREAAKRHIELIVSSRPPRPSGR